MTGQRIPADQASDPLCLELGEAALLLQGASWRRFAVVGDSLSAGIGDEVPGYGNAGWAERVADVLCALDPSVSYLNSGEIGATTRRVLDTQMTAMHSFGPDLLHLPCGPNDIFVREPDFGAIEADMTMMYELSVATGAQLTTFTLGSVFQNALYDGWAARVETINVITRKLASRYDAIVVDMFDHPVNDRPNLVSADGLHFSTLGQAVMATEYVRSLSSRL